jgi:hypothetical protein
LTAELIREAYRGEQKIARFRCYDDGGLSIVEAEVTPADGGASVNRGPYRFATAHEAFRFLQEAMLALQYLGCTISS